MLMIKKMTIDDESKAAESIKRKKYQCERCSMIYARGNMFLVSKQNLVVCLDTSVFFLAWVVWLRT